MNNAEPEPAIPAAVRGVPRLAWDFARTPGVATLRRSGIPITTDELNEAAGLAWKVYQTPAFFFVADEAEPQIAYDPNGAVSMVPANGYWKLVAQHGDGAEASPAYYLNVREDTQEVVGIVKRRYRILQNDEAPRFLDQVVEAGEATWEVAGALHHGALVFWLMNLEDAPPMTTDRDEVLRTHLLLINSHDGSTSTTVAAIASRPRSQVTLAYPLPTAVRVIKVRHTVSARDRAIEARRACETGWAYHRELVELAHRMIEFPLSDGAFHDFLRQVVATPAPRRTGTRTVNQRGITVAENTKGLITSVYFHNEMQENIRGTLWGAVQACQFVADHLSTSRNTEASADENRFKRLTSESTLGSKAFLLARRRLPR